MPVLNYDMCLALVAGIDALSGGITTFESSALQAACVAAGLGTAVIQNSCKAANAIKGAGAVIDFFNSLSPTVDIQATATVIGVGSAPQQNNNQSPIGPFQLPPIELPCANVTDVIVTPPSLTLGIGQSGLLKSEIFDNAVIVESSVYNTTWQSANDAEVTVSDNGSATSVSGTQLGTTTASVLGVAATQTSASIIATEPITSKSGSAAITVNGPEFWQGSYQITTCNAPGAVGTGGADAYCNEVMSWPAGAAYSSGQISFRSVTTENFNFRRDYFEGGSSVTSVCKADTISIGPTSSSFTENTWAEASYGTAGLYDANQVTYTITSWTPQAISGTFSAPVPYLVAQTGNQSDWATGSVQGTWQATPRASPFPKCVPPSTSNLYCQNVSIASINGGQAGVDGSPPAGTLIPCSEPFLPLTSPYRPGEWQGFP